jgi:hypothetical protein
MKMYLLHRKAFRFVAGKGLGMVAQRRILPGEIILEEAPLIILPDDIYAGRRQETVSHWWWHHLTSCTKVRDYIHC